MTLRILALSSLALAATAQATDYNIVTIDAPGADRTFVLDINDSGQWAGYAVVDIPGTPGLYSSLTGQADGSGLTLLTRPGTIGIGASGINASGAISGVSVDLAFQATGFVRSPSGTYTDIDPSTGGITSAYSEAVDLNDNGMVVGFYTETVPLTEQEASVSSHGYMLSGGVYTTLDYPGMGNHGTQFYSVNNAGTASGRYLDSFGLSHGILWNAGTGFVETSVPGFFSTENGGLNQAGDYISLGYVPDADPSNPYGVLVHSFIHRGGTYVPFTIAGARSTIAYGINDRGQVVGAYVDTNYAFHGFTATPVPEPMSLAALGLGLGAILRRRRK